MRRYSSRCALRTLALVLFAALSSRASAEPVLFRAGGTNGNDSQHDSLSATAEFDTS